jgi:hypothetical protein
MGNRRFISVFLEIVLNIAERGVYPRFINRAFVMVVPNIGLWAMAQPPILLRLHAQARPGSTPKRIRFFLFCSKFLYSHVLIF